MDHKKKLYVLTAHLDDFELSCLAYLFKHAAEYSSIHLIVASTNDFKNGVTLENIGSIKKLIKSTIDYKNCGFRAQALQSYFDELKHEIYTMIDWHSSFDVMTHTIDDLHTDHQVIANIAMGLFKYCEKYTEFYSPSTKDFSPNYFIPMSSELYALKDFCCQKYDIQKDESYTKMGYYLDDHRNLGKLYTYENHVKYTSEYFEVYSIKKQMTSEASLKG